MLLGLLSASAASAQVTLPEGYESVFAGETGEALPVEDTVDIELPPLEEPSSGEAGSSEDGDPAEGAQQDGPRNYEPDGSLNLTALPTGEARAAVTPSRISLPSAEGSIEGMGESFSPVLSSGTGTFSVPIALPAGRAGVQPSLGLSYATSGGNSCVGFGWNLGAPFIVRQSDRGLPRYLDDPAWHPEEDRFFYAGGQELVPVDSAEMATVDASGLYSGAADVPAEVEGWQQYRARIEGGFLRFFRSPDLTRWVVQGKDGTRFDFGLLPASGGPPDIDPALALQTETPGDSTRVYRWLLTRMSDAHGSTVYYRYEAEGGERYLRDIFYLSPASCADTDAAATRACAAPLEDYGARVHLDYETRPDVFSRHTAGWRIETALRLRRVTATAYEGSLGERALVRRYHLTYVDEGESFHSLLASVQVEGRPDHPETNGLSFRVFNHVTERALGDTVVGRLLPAMRFSYSTPPEGPVTGFGGVADRVAVVEASPSVSVDAARAALIDVNTDGLPDLVVTDPARYRTASGDPAVGVFFNGFRGPAADPAGAAAVFSDPVAVPMPASLSGTLNLGSRTIVSMDVEGDGRSDLLHLPRLDRYGYFTPTRQSDAAAGNSPSPSAQGWSFTYAQVELDAVGDDPRIDLAGDGSHYEVFDVNGDHLIDVVRTTGTAMQTWLNLGFVPGAEGRFGQADYDGADWQISTEPHETCLLYDGLPLDFADPEVRLADMNGDGLQDIVKVRAGRLVYWPGRGITGDGAPIFGEGPAACPRGAGAGRQVVMDAMPTAVNPDLSQVFLRDINADGAADLVQVRYHELDVWFNRAGRDFSERATVGMPFAPDYASRIRFADLDGSATVDLVYGNAGRWEYVDLLGGQRPRMLVQVESGLGATTRLTYGSSAEDYVTDLEAAAAGGDATGERFLWSEVDDGCDAVLERLAGECVQRSAGSPAVSTVVRSIETTDNFDRVGREANVLRTEFAYHDGYYEGIEQEFRGFGAADAVAYGDADHPTSWTRSHFHQGRRPTALESDRLADNPYEALKGRQWRSETFDESGVFLSTSLATCTVRRLATGLDGRAVSYAYVSESSELRYDTSAFLPGTDLLSIETVREQEVGASGAIPASASAVISESVPVRGSVWAQIRSSTGEVDNLGHVLEQTAHGRARDEFTGAPVAEAIVSHTTPALVDGEQWIWRTAASHVTGDGTSVPLGVTRNTYDEVGDLVRSESDASIDGGLSLSFAGDGAGAEGFALSQAYPSGTQLLFATTTYDAWGNARETCAAGDVSAGTCKRYAAVTYDAAFAQLPVTEAIAVHDDAGASYCSGVGAAGFCTLATSATWDRGFGVLLSATDPNSATAAVRYDGLGRTTASFPADTGYCDGRPNTALRYELVPGGAPVSYVQTEVDPNCEGGATWSRAYVDGLGRPRATLSNWGLNSGRKWERSGVAVFSARGTPLAAHNNDNFGDEDPAPAVALALPATPAVRTEYDAFGRAVRAQERDQSVSMMEYGALWTAAWDPNDIAMTGVAAQTPSVLYVDGHGRTEVQILLNRFTNGGPIETYRLRTTYRPDGAATSITRAQVTSGGDYGAMRDAAVVSSRSLTRTFGYDTAGRRLTTLDPDSQSSTGDNWRYLFGDAGDLVAVRDARGCGQNFYYDRAGRLVGEDYVACSEAQASGEVTDVSVPAGSVGLGVLGASQAVDVLYEFDVAPSWVSGAPSGALLGRLTGTSDRGQRSAVVSDARGRAFWSRRQMAMLPEIGSVDVTPSGELPAVNTGDAPSSTITRTYDEAHSYVVVTGYDNLDRPTSMVLPADPDFGGTPPAVVGEAGWDRRGLPHVAEAVLGGVQYRIFDRYFDVNRLVSTTYLGDQTGGSHPATISTPEDFDERLRPKRTRMGRSRTPGAAPESLGDVGVVFDERYTWDGANNLTRVRDTADRTEWPDEQLPREVEIGHDALYRVSQVDIRYLTSWKYTASSLPAVDWRDAYAGQGTSDPMRRTPAPRVSEPADRPLSLTYEYDWLANMVEWTDDAGAFHERSLGDTDDDALRNGADESLTTLRPTALYLASNIRSMSGAIDSAVDRGGWVHLGYGESGNVETVTVRGQCVDEGSGTACWDDRTLGLAARAAHLATSCACAAEQHYQYRWDELNRIAEARRYDRSSAAGVGRGDWQLEVRQRYRYDAGNQRMVKQSRDGFAGTTGTGGTVRAALYVYPGDFERRGLVPDGVAEEYDGDAGTTFAETQYLIGGARIVWKAGSHGGTGFERDARIVWSGTDLLGSTAATIDLLSGELLERTTYLPSGVPETHRSNSAAAAFSLEPAGFTGKEGDHEVGLTYFGHRYLLAHLGRWASADPLQVHAGGGGEFGNSYHYVAGNLLQATDPNGLEVVESFEPAGNDAVEAGVVVPGHNPDGTPNGAQAWVETPDGTIMAPPEACNGIGPDCAREMVALSEGVDGNLVVYRPDGCTSALYCGSEAAVTWMDRAVIAASVANGDFLGGETCGGATCSGGTPDGSADGEASVLQQVRYLGSSVPAAVGAILAKMFRRLARMRRTGELASDTASDASGGGAPASSSVRRVPQTPVGGTVDNLIAGSRPGRRTMGRTRQFERHGDFNQANADFNALGPTDVTPIPGGGSTGRLSGGRRAIVRPTSTEGSPTLEIQSGRNRIKFRFIGD